MVIRDPPLNRRPASPSTVTPATAVSPPAHQKGCNSATCCSPAKIWRNLQTLIKEDNPEALIKHFKEADERRLQHIVRVALTARLSNDASLYPPSQQHKLIRLTSREATVCFGKSFRDLNSLQFALLTSSESTVLALLSQLKTYAAADNACNESGEKWTSYINHIWGQGNTTLHLAAHLGRREVVKQLLELGCCKLRVRNARNKYAEDCCMGDQRICSDILAFHKSITTTAHEAVNETKHNISSKTIKNTGDQTKRTMKLAAPVGNTRKDIGQPPQQQLQQPALKMSTVSNHALESVTHQLQTKQQVTERILQQPQQYLDNQCNQMNVLSDAVVALITTNATTDPDKIHEDRKPLPFPSLRPTSIQAFKANKVLATTLNNTLSSLVQQTLKVDRLRTGSGHDSHLSLSTPYLSVSLLDDLRRCIVFHDQQEQLKKPPDKVTLQQSLHYYSYLPAPDYCHNSGYSNWGGNNSSVIAVH